MITIKDIISTSPNFKRIGVHFEKIEEEKLDEIFGPPNEKITINDEYFHLVSPNNPFAPDPDCIFRLCRVPNRKYHILLTIKKTRENFISVYRCKNEIAYEYLEKFEEGNKKLKTDRDSISEWSNSLDNKTIIELLLDHLGFIDIQRLRKVCFNIRTCIDHFQPISTLAELDVCLTCAGFVFC